MKQWTFLTTKLNAIHKLFSVAKYSKWFLVKSNETLTKHTLKNTKVLAFYRTREGFTEVSTTLLQASEYAFSGVFYRQVIEV